MRTRYDVFNGIKQQNDIVTHFYLCGEHLEPYGSKTMLERVTIKLQQFNCAIFPRGDLHEGRVISCKSSDGRRRKAGERTDRIVSGNLTQRNFAINTLSYFREINFGMSV